MKKSAKSTRPVSRPRKAAPAEVAPIKPKTAKKAPVPVVKKTAAAAPPPQPIAPASRLLLPTVITAQIDIGFGNQLYLRGEGADALSWNQGIALECIADDRWTLTLADTSRPITFKFLINDRIWSTGENYVAGPGGHVVLVPAF